MFTPRIGTTGSTLFIVLMLLVSGGLYPVASVGPWTHFAEAIFPEIGSQVEPGESGVESQVKPASAGFLDFVMMSVHDALLSVRQTLIVALPFGWQLQQVAAAMD